MSITKLISICRDHERFFQLSEMNFLQENLRAPTVETRERSSLGWKALSLSSRNYKRIKTTVTWIIPNNGRCLLHGINFEEIKSEWTVKCGKHSMLV